MHGSKIIRFGYSLRAVIFFPNMLEQNKSSLFQDVPSATCGYPMVRCALEYNELHCLLTNRVQTNQTSK